MIKNKIKSFTLFFVLVFTSIGGELFDPAILYLTWQSHPESSMTVQWVSNKERVQDQVEYRPQGTDKWEVAYGKHQPMPDGYPFLIHRVELLGLRPNSDYEFRPGQDAAIYKFKTMPDNLNEPIRFVEGGDVYHDGIEAVSEMNRQAALTNPSFAIVGGDLAYSVRRVNPFLTWFAKENAERWFEWLSAWKKDMVTPDGRLIPIVATIGNHEVIGKGEQSPKRAAFYYAFFPSSVVKTLDFGNYMSLFILDSGHTNSIMKQARWLKSTLEERRQVPHKFAIYHVGAYPSVRKLSEGTAPIIRQYWVPLFEKYGLCAAFEHHDHAYKRTHPLLKGKPDPLGVLYIGDGAWGVEEPRVPATPLEKPYLAASAAKRHVILVILDSFGEKFVAIDTEGNVFDTFDQKMESK